MWRTFVVVELGRVLIFDKAGKTSSRIKTVSSINGAGNIGQLHEKE